MGWFAEKLASLALDGTPIPVDVGAAHVTVNASDIQLGSMEIQSPDGARRVEAKAATALVEADVALAAHDPSVGLSTDAAVVTNAVGTLSGKLRGLVAIFADVWDSTNHFLKVRQVVAGAAVDGSGTIAAGSTAQDALAANANRRYLFVMNPSAETEVLGVNFGVTAVTTGQPSILLAPGDWYEMSGSAVFSDRVSVKATTTGHKFVAKEI